MTLTMLLLFAIGVPVAAWLVSIALERFARREEEQIELPPRRYDLVWFWSIAILNQMILTIGEWKARSWRLWFLLCLLVFSITAAAIEVRKKTKTPGRTLPG